MKSSPFFLNNKMLFLFTLTLVMSWGESRFAFAQSEDPGLTQATEIIEAAALTDDFSLRGYDAHSPLGLEEQANPTHISRPQEVIMPHAAVLHGIQTINKVVKDINPNDKACDCNFSYSGHQTTVEFESEKSCNENRNYFSDNIAEFAKIDPSKSYVKTRTSEVPKDSIPRKCVTYVMRSFLEGGSQLNASDSFATCDIGQGVPRQGAFKACVTEDYVNLVYNSFVDVADCMGLPQRMMAPKFLIESGFHINAFGALRVYDHDVKKDSLKNMLDIRVCQPIDKATRTATKIAHLKDLVPCNKAKTDAYLKGEAAMKDKLAKKKITPEQMREWRSSNEAKLRDVFDFKKADNGWFEELSNMVSNKDACKKNFIESFCGHKLSIIGGDAGIGQFTTSAAAEAENQAASTEKAIRSSSKDSCKRIVNIPHVFDVPKKDLESRCGFIKSPPNPLAALVKYGSLLKAIQKNIGQLWDTHNPDRWGGKSITDLMKAAKVSDADTAKIQDMLTVLSYNAGPSTAVILYGNWLQSRIQNLGNYKVSKEDFSFNPKTPPEFEKTDGKTVDGWKQELLSLQKKKDLSGSEKSRLAKLKSLKIDHLDFSNYLRAYREGWAKGYLKYVKDAADKLDKTFGNGVCTQNNFLSL